MQVDGNADKCSLPTVAVDTGASAPLAFVNAHPSGCPVIFEWGASVLTLSRRTRLLAFGDHELTDAPLGDLYVRLVLGEPPYEPLSEPMRVTVAPQPRNLFVAFAGPEYTGAPRRARRRRRRRRRGRRPTTPRTR